MRPLVARWKSVTVEMLSELHRAREALSSQGARNDLVANATKSWTGYVADIGLDRSTVHRWLSRFNPETGEILDKPAKSLPAPGSPVLIAQHVGRYPIVYADPPWSYEEKAANSSRWAGAESHYPCMSVAELSALDVDGRSVPELAGDDALLFLWATMPLLPDALRVIEAWDFEYKTAAFVWIKRTDDGPQLGLGNYTRQNAELCLLARRGRGVPRQDMSVNSVIECPRMEHSRKPAGVRDRIVQLCGDLPRIELFAREKVEGWDAWGKEALQEPLRFAEQ